MPQNHTISNLKYLLMGNEDLGFLLSLHNSEGINLANLKLFGTEKECEANAKFIVKCCNSHEALVEALKELKGSLLILKAPKESLLKAENALKLAEGE